MVKYDMLEGEMMNQKELLIDLRSSGILKGIKPVMVKLNKNKGGIYLDGKADFVMTIKGELLHFQRLSVFLKKPIPNLDFSVNLKNFKEYSIVSMNSYVNCLYLYNKKNNYLQIFYSKGLKETYFSEDNLFRMLKDMEKIGIKEIKGE
jgi:hypothetical protein